MIQVANASIFICHVIVVIMSMMPPDKEKELGAKVHVFEEIKIQVNFLWRFLEFLIHFKRQKFN